MPNTVLGKVSVVPKGDYNASVQYYALDIVGYQGGSYLAMKEVLGVAPSNDQVNWMQLSGPGLPGEQGPQGVPGTAAGFGEATATVDDTSGTPSVDVQTSGPDTAKVFTFTFSGLKGTKGDTGEKGDTGDTGPTGPQGVSVVTAQINEQGHLIITLSEGEPIDAGDATGPVGPQGNQGEAGESVDSIQRTSGTGAPGTTDTYTMYSTDGSEIGTFTVYNGQNGTGAGDFMADGSVPMTGNLDMNGNRVTEVGTPTADTDAANKAYVDTALEGVTITTDATPTQGSENAVQSGGVYNALSDKQDTLSGTEDQLVGFNSAGEAVAVAKPTADDVGAVPSEDVGVANGIAELDGNGKLVESQKPTYTADEVGARPDTWTPDAEDVGAMPAVTGGTTGQVLTKTETGQKWSDAPDGLPEGGSEGQVLTKTASGTAWDDVPSDLPAGGTDGQILTKTTDGTAWEDAPSGLPDGGKNGQVLTVGTDGPEWADVPSELPSGGTAGQVLAKTDDGTEWADPAESETQTVTLLSTGWTQSGDRYSQTVNCSIVAADTPVVVVDVALSGTDIDADNEALSAWAGPSANNVTQGAGTLTFYSVDAPTVNIPVNVGVC